MSKVKVTISVLLSDRIGTIRRCLDSLAPLREAVNSELILTVTTDDERVYRLAEEYGDRILRFRWCNDFSRARNAGLEAARGSWFLYLDDDEWFEDCGELIRFFNGECEKYAYVDYIQRNYQDRELHYYSDTPVSRMVNLDFHSDTSVGLYSHSDMLVSRMVNQHFHSDTPVRRMAGSDNEAAGHSAIRFRSRIHEYFDPVTGPGKLLGNTIANHTGYIQADQGDQMKRFRRNAPLLMQMAEEEPEQLRWLVQLVQEYRQVELWPWEAELGRKGLEKLDKQQDPDAFGAFCGAVVEGLVESGRGSEALSEIENALKDSRCLDMTKAFLYLEKALVLLRAGIAACQPENCGNKEMDGALTSESGNCGSGKQENREGDPGNIAEDSLICQSEEEIVCYLQLYRKFYLNPKKKARESAMVITGEAVEKISRIKAESIRLCCRLLAGDYGYFEKALPVLEWEQPAVYLLEELVSIWARVLSGPHCISAGISGDNGIGRPETQKLPSFDVFQKPLQLAWKNPGIREKLLGEFQKNETMSLLEQTARLEDDHWYVSYAKICVGGPAGTGGCAGRTGDGVSGVPDSKGSQQGLAEIKGEGDGTRGIYGSKGNQQSPVGADRKGDNESVSSQEHSSSDSDMEMAQAEANRRKLYVNYFNHCENIFLVPDMIWKIAASEGLTWEELAAEIDFLKLSRDIADYYNKDYRELTVKRKTGTNESIRNQTDAGSRCETGISLDVVEILDLWIKKGLAYTYEIYNPKVICEKPQILPASCRAVLCFESIRTIDNKIEKSPAEAGSVESDASLNNDAAEIKEKISCLKKAIQEWPDLVSFAKEYLEAANLAIEARSDKKSAAANEEMRKLAGQILEQVQILLEQGEMEQARTIVSQLRTMLPEDEEIKRLERELK